MTTPGRLLWTLLALCVLSTLMAPHVRAGQASTQAQRKQVLLLFDEDRTLPGLSILEQSIRSTLVAALGDTVEIFTESMHAAQFPEEQHDIVLRDFYQRKYGSRKLDLIIGVMGPTVAFLQQHAETFAPGVPIVFCGADARDLAGITRPAHMTGLLVRRIFAPTLETALRLQPGAQQVFVVAGTSEFDRHLLATARRDFAAFEPRASFTYLTDLPMPELLEAVSRVPPRSIILYVSLFRDGAGQTFVPHDTVARIATTATAPVYVFIDQFLGSGAVGGYVYSVEMHGRASAEVGLRVLRGERPAEIPVREVPGNRYIFDARQLDRWKLDAGLLPDGSQIRFREPGAWERYRSYIIGGVTLVTVQAALIVGLLVHRARRRRAESELRNSFDRIRELGRRLLTAQETERTRIARELHDDISQQLAVLSIDLQYLSGLVDGPAEAVATGAVKHANDIGRNLRSLSHDLYPTKLRLAGLVASLESLIADLGQHNCVVTFTHEGVPANLPPELTLCVFRIVQEALQNAIKHGHAKAISVTLIGTGGRLDVSVADDGVGFVVDAVGSDGIGLISMKERVEAMDGRFDVVSRPHGGTRVTVSMPVR